MRPLGDERAHYWRVMGMSHACEVDLQKALVTGKLTHTDYAAMIHRCRGCERVGACDRTLAAGHPRDEAPEYCVNHDVFERLKRAEQ